MGARIHFTDASLTKLTLSPGDKGLKAILDLKATLTPDIAAHLKCGHHYENNGNPREHTNNFALDVILRDVDLIIPSPYQEADYLEVRPEMVWKFKAEKVDEFKYELKMIVHVYGKDDDMLHFAQKFNKREFELAIRSLQMEFDLTAENPGGSQLDMSGKKDDDDDAEAGDAESEGPLFASCVHCDTEVPLTEDRTGHVGEDGEVIPCSHPAGQPSREKAEPLPTAQSMGAGRGRKRAARTLELVGAGASEPDSEA
jgi:hypothetical protein